ncbi:MAG: PD40 domain-containing protein [Bacteroides sp.]|nr:PD40 domain-containing protein [Bacteroides sp.]
MKKTTILTSICALFTACSSNIQVEQTLSTHPAITPDYIGVTVPVNIAPLHFGVPDSCKVTQLNAIFRSSNKQVTVRGSHQIAPSASEWKELMQEADDSIQVCIQVEKEGKWKEYAPFPIYVKKDKIDSHLAYRLIEPGYEIWNEMGIYQRCLENFDESAILTNKMTGYGCMNCHSFHQYNPDKMMLHLRVDYGGTYLIDQGNIEKLNTKTPQTQYALVYPSWHTSGDYIAFSVNNTKQMFHTTDPNRIEVMDFASNVVVYDVKRHEIFTAPQLFSPTSFETFPNFSPDGKTLYFCSADSVAMPNDYKQVKYSLCSIAYDAESRTFGTQVDTLFHAQKENKSVSFPRVSPDGKYLMFTLSSYGNFSIWHKEADLYLADIQSREIRPMQTLNSADVESYHSWSSNGRWVVFSSRRENGLYTQPFIAYIDENGQAHKPFLLPQKDIQYYDKLMKSFNVPEFVSGKVQTDGYSISRTAKTSAGIDVTFHKN